MRKNIVTNTLLHYLKYKTLAVLILTLTTPVFNSCKTGCNDKKACNYNSKKKLKGSCSYSPENVKSATMPRSWTRSAAWGLNLKTGEIKTINGQNNSPIKDFLYFYAYQPNMNITRMEIEGSDAIADMGHVNSLCEVTNKSGTYGNPTFKENTNGYMIYFRSTNTYARVHVTEVVRKMHEDVIEVSYEYPF